MDWKETIEPTPTTEIADYIRAAKSQQAEISFKAGIGYGIWLFAWWKDGVQYVGTCGTTLEKALKEYGA